MKSNSWIIVKKDTLEAIFETFQRSVADKVNMEKYDVLDAYTYLCLLNRQIKEASL